MLYQTEPEDFRPEEEAVGCFVERDGEILLLHRLDRKPQGDTWGLPSGTVEEGETPIQALRREVKEETGLILPRSDVSHFGRFFVRYPDRDFVYHVFHFRLESDKEVETRDDEHKDFKWIEPSGALKLDLIRDLDTCIELFYG